MDFASIAVGFLGGLLFFVLLGSFYMAGKVSASKEKGK